MTERVLDHVGIAVHSLDEAVSLFSPLVEAAAEGHETVESQGVEVVFVGAGTGRMELLAPLRQDSAIARFLERRGPGLHHVCYRVANVEAALAEAVARGYRAIDERPRPGAHGARVAFLHPRTTGGVLIELLQPPGGDSG